MKKKLICIGNEWRRDDGIGLKVAELLKIDFAQKQQEVIDQFKDKQFEIQTCTRESMELIEAMRGWDWVVIVDAVQLGSPAGSVFEFDLSNEKLPEKIFSYSTHAFSVNQTIELAQILGSAPSSIHVFGIEGSDFTMGKGLSLEVEKSIPQVCDKILALINKNLELKHA